MSTGKAKFMERLGIKPKGQLAKHTQKELVSSFVQQLRDSFNVKGTFSWNPMAEKVDEAITRQVGLATAEDIATNAAEIAQASEERKARMVATKAAIEDPQTLEDFETRARYKVPELTTEQVRRYEDLKADARRAAVATSSATVQAVGLGDVAMELHATKHTKTGEDLHVVTLSQRVDKDLYQSLNARAKQLGGYYSSYRGSGAIAGFTFKTQEAAQAFMATEATQINPTPEAVEERQAEKKAKVSSKLRDMAEKMTEKAEDELGRDRKTHTHRYAAQAASSIGAAESSKALARTMTNLADAIEDGRAKHLGGLKNRIQIEELNTILRAAIRARRRSQGLSYAQEQAEQGRPANQEDIDHAVYPYPSLWKDHLTSQFDRLGKVPGLARASVKIQKMMQGATEDKSVVFERPDQIELLSEIATKLEKHPDPETKWLKEKIKDTLRSFNRLQSAGIETPEQLRAALREFLVYKSMTQGEDPIKAAERSLIGAKIPGYFPTPQVLAEEVIDKANIQPGMRILEPSAGKGSLIDALHAKHGKDFQVDAIEPIESLRTILAAKGHTLAGRDILEHNPGPVYDRVIMNPPFENGQDMDHVRKAYDLLKPGGRLVAITGAGAHFRGDKKATAFREWLDELGAESEQNPEGSFKASGTGTNTYTVVIDKPLNAA